MVNRKDAAFMPKNHNGLHAANGDNGRLDVPIRDYMPRLRAGTHISDRAKALCIKDHGFSPRGGLTYNSGHTPNGDTVVPKKIRYVLSDQLIQKELGAPSATS